MVGITMHKVLAFTVVALTGVNALAISTPCPEENGKVTYAGKFNTLYRWPRRLIMNRKHPY